jgi:regulator of protease activity HflC (stomatin/prohibitin superfamily)
MIQRRPIPTPSKTSPFLGIGVGKKAKAEAQAKIDLINAQAAANERAAKIEADTLALKMAQAQAGFNPEKDATEAVVKVEETKAATTNNLYYIIGFGVVALMIGLYFISKKH